ncbi:MAG: M23 family metallopeptidase, partial [Acetatifactor sp.]|nr:M23 family metallopeptidase [Acetatifactor sp.]
IIGAIIGVFIYEEQLWELARQRNNQQQEAMNKLEEEKKRLEDEIYDLNDKIQYLSDTVNQNLQEKTELESIIEEQSTPREFPLTGSASMEEIGGDTPMCVFTASSGITVVATASGTVTEVVEDEEYGYAVKIDHGNGYISIYRNQGEPMVKQGDTVAQGTTLYLIGENNAKLAYQMMKDDVYINPMDMLEING